MVAIGDDQGQAHVFKYDQNVHKVDDENPNPKLLTKTKYGMAFGAVTSVCLKSDGTTLLVGSESGEIMSYDLKDTIRD